MDDQSESVVESVVGECETLFVLGQLVSDRREAFGRRGRSNVRRTRPRAQALAGHRVVGWPTRRIRSWTRTAEGGKPGSVPGRSPGGHLSGAPVTRRLVRPTRNSSAADNRSLLFGLAPGGVCRAAAVAGARGGLLPHPFTLACTPDEPDAIGGLLSVTLSVASRRPGVTRHHVLRSPDFPRTGPAADRDPFSFRLSRPLLGASSCQYNGRSRREFPRPGEPANGRASETSDCRDPSCLAGHTLCWPKIVTGT